jgi:hypothetical protein
MGIKIQSYGNSKDWLVYVLILLIRRLATTLCMLDEMMDIGWYTVYTLAAQEGHWSLWDQQDAGKSLHLICSM